MEKDKENWKGWILILIVFLMAILMANYTYSVEIFSFNDTINNTIGNITGTLNSGSRIFHNSSYCISGSCIVLNDTKITMSALPISNIHNRAEWTISCWVYPETQELIAQYVRIGDNSVDSGFSMGRQDEDKFALNYRGIGWTKSDVTYNLRNWYHVVWRYTNVGSHKADLWINGTNVTETGDNNAAANAPTTADWGHYGNAFDPSYMWQGKIDECQFYETALSGIQINELYNSYLNTTPPPSPNNPPTIVFNSQIPSNITYSNIINDINITYNITDEDINESTIKLEVILNNTRLFINGTEVILNTNHSYLSNDNKTYFWKLDEEDILGGTQNINGDLFDNGTLLNATLTTANQWVKMQFFNVSNDVPQQFFEIMDENISATLDTDTYYYCNSSYVSGSVTANSNCVLMASVPNNVPHNHTQGNSRHRVFNMNINVSNGKIGGVFVTPESYVLKRGNNAGTRYYYLNIATRQNTTQTTINNGVSWTSQPYTINAHINSIRSNATIQYRARATDRIGNTTISNWNTDLPDVFNSPPTNVIIYNPISSSYNGTILINHSASFSESGATIVNYTYYYMTESHSTNKIYIGMNTHPTTEYNWDVSNLVNGNYILEVIVKDSNGLSSDTESEIFVINNPLTIDQQYLNSIDTTLNLIYEVLSMIPMMMLYIFITLLGYYVLKRENLYIGVGILLFSFGFDFFIAGWIYDTYINGLDGNTMVGMMTFIFGVTLLVFIISKLSMILFSKNISVKTR